MSGLARAAARVALASGLVLLAGCLRLGNESHFRSDCPFLTTEWVQWEQPGLYELLPPGTDGAWTPVPSQAGRYEATFSGEQGIRMLSGTLGSAPQVGIAAILDREGGVRANLSVPSGTREQPATHPAPAQAYAWLEQAFRELGWPEPALPEQDMPWRCAQQESAGAGAA